MALQFTQNSRGTLVFTQNYNSPRLLSFTLNRANFMSAVIGQSGTISVGSVTNGTPLSITNVGTDTDAIFDFVIPTASGSALTKVDDTNITLTLSAGAPTALVNATSITVGWAGTLALSRLAQGTDGQLIVGQTSAAPQYKSITGDISITAAGAVAVNALHSGALANPTGTIGLTAVNGSATTAMRSDGAPALGVTISPTWTGNHTFSPTSGNALTVNTAAASAALGLNVTQSGPTSGSTAGTVSNATQGNPALVYNQFYITSEGADVTGATDPKFTYGSNVAMVTGGANSTGSKVAHNVFLFHSAASAPATGRDHIALNSSFLADFGDGGTGTTPGTAKGTFFGAGFQALLRSGATNVFSISGAEIDVGISTGASAAYRFGWSLIGTGDLQATTLDTALEISSSGQPWGMALALTNIHGSAPLSASGTVIGSDGSSVTATDFCNLSTYTFTGNIFNFGSPFTVTGAGAGTLAYKLTITNVTADNAYNILDVSKNWSSAGATNLMASFTSYADAARLVIRRANGTAASPTAVASSDVLGNINFRGYYTSGGTAFTTGVAAVSATAAENFTSTAWGTDLAFTSTPIGSVTTATRLSISANGNIVPGTAALATNATDGFTYVQTCAGTPTGTPTAYTGRVAMIFDTTNKKLYFYNGAWQRAQVTAVDAIYA